MQKGTIARIMDKGYGFIKVEGQEKDLFFHSNDVSGVMFDELSEGDVVTFEATQGDKGPQASNVQLASDDAPSADTDEGSSDEEASDEVAE